jgi:hypothetical protein
VRPLGFDDPFILSLAQAIGARTPIDAPDSPPPKPTEVAALCNVALQLCVSRYEGESLFTTVLLFDSADRQAPGFVKLSSGPAWRAIARGFPEGIAASMDQGTLRAFAGLAVPFDETHPAARSVPRALVVPGAVGITVGGELLAELRPGQAPEVLAAPRPTLELLLAEAGLHDGSVLRPAQLRRVLKVARQQRHGATVVVTSAKVSSDTLPLAGAAVEWPELQGGLGGPDRDRLADALGRLAAVDGAVVINHAGVVFGFGLRLNARPDVTGTARFSDRLGHAAEERTENPFTGSRRRSALDYVTTHPGCFALVLSSDGPLSLVSRREGVTVVQRGLECLL